MEKTERLLLIDDDETFARVLARALGARGFSVSTAHDAVSALSLLRREHPSHCVLDLKLGADKLPAGGDLRDRVAHPTGTDEQDPHDPKLAAEPSRGRGASRSWRSRRASRAQPSSATDAPSSAPPIVSVTQWAPR